MKYDPTLPTRPTSPFPQKETGHVEKWARAREKLPITPVKYDPGDLKDHFEFFNHGLLFSIGGFDPYMDPVGDWYAQQHGVEAVLRQPFPYRLFRGMEAKIPGENYTWDFVLCAAPKYAWEDLREHLCGMAVTDHRGSLYTVFYQKLYIPDPVVVAKSRLLRPDTPKIPVTLFCIDSVDGRFVFSPGSLASPPALRRLPPTRITQKTAKALAKEDIQPIIDRRNPAFLEFLQKYQKAAKEQKG